MKPWINFYLFTKVQNEKETFIIKIMSDNGREFENSFILIVESMELNVFFPQG